MTNEEAIQILKTWRITGDKTHEALDMAITALGAIDRYRRERDIAVVQFRELGEKIGTETYEDMVPRTSVEYICQKNTVSTNPYEHKYHDKFIQFMDDPEISDFGRWQHSNGFNTALVAVKCDLDKVPSAEPKTGVWLIRRFGNYARCSVCGHSYNDVYDLEDSDAYCRHCGSKMEGLKVITDE